MLTQQQKIIGLLVILVIFYLMQNKNKEKFFITMPVQKMFKIGDKCLSFDNNKFTVSACDKNYIALNATYIMKGQNNILARLDGKHFNSDGSMVNNNNYKPVNLELSTGRIFVNTGHSKLFLNVDGNKVTMIETTNLDDTNTGTKFTVIAK